MNIQAWENRQWFERIMALRDKAEPNRVIPADGWTPDTSMLDLATISQNTPTPRSSLWQQAANEEFRKQTEDWYSGQGGSMDEGVDMEFKTGHTFTFTTPYQYGPVGWSDEDFAARVGTEAKVVGLAPDDEYDRDDVGDMYVIIFTSDGATMTVWPEEIDPTLIG